MNVYQIVEKVRDHAYEGPGEKYSEQLLYLLAENVHEVSGMLEPDGFGRTVEAIRFVCTLTEFPEQMYRTTASTESGWSDSIERAEVLKLMEGAEERIRRLKRRLVGSKQYDLAALARDAQSKIRRLKGGAVTLEELFRKQACTESSENGE